METIITTIFILIGLLVYGQNFKDTRTRPYYANDIKVKDTTFIEGKIVQWSGSAWVDVGGTFSEAGDYDFTGDNTFSQPVTFDSTVFVNAIKTIEVPNQTMFPKNLWIGTGGSKSDTTTGVIDPVDPLPWESNGSVNGWYNTFVGIDCGEENITGNYSVFVGSLAGAEHINGTQNTFVGHSAGRLVESGYHNTYLGCGAGDKNVDGFYNVMIGTDCGLSSTAGNENTFVGASSGRLFQTGTGNVFLGYRAAYDVTTGTHLYISNGEDNGAKENTWIYGNSTYDVEIPNGDLVIGSYLVNGIQSKTFTILKPDEAQTETDDVILMYVDATAYPYGITIQNLTMSTSASCTDTHELEIWADRVGTSQSTIESITCSGQETDVDGGDIDTPGVDAGEYINVNLDNATDDISSLEITITFTINES